MTTTGIKRPVARLSVTLVASGLTVFVLCLPLLFPAFTYTSVPMIAAVMTGAAPPLILDPDQSGSLWIIAPVAFLFFCILVVMWFDFAEITFRQQPVLGEMFIALVVSWLLIRITLATGLTIGRTVLQPNRHPA